MSSAVDDERSEQDWQRSLTPEQYRVLREGGTEAPFTGRYVDSHEDGVYRCAGCESELFSSQTKFESGSGWPSFYQPIDLDRVELLHDSSFGMTRTEVKCGHCGAHLGHVFNDGPPPTGLRYCINSISLDLEPSESERQ